MSQKIKSKDLSYDQNLPPFLQRLRAQNTGSGDAARREREIARPRKQHIVDQEDEPTIVDESGEQISRSELEKRNVVEKNAPNSSTEELSRPEGTSKTIKPFQKDLTNATSIAKKRKVVKVIGDDSTAEGAEHGTPSVRTVKAAKKKSKPIRLAFDEDDGS